MANKRSIPSTVADSELCTGSGTFPYHWAHRHKREQSKMMRWLSTANFWGKQVDLLERAQAGTGGWIFEDDRSKSWLAGRSHLL
jgi:hypothetical protein